MEGTAPDPKGGLQCKTIDRNNQPFKVQTSRASLIIQKLKDKNSKRGLTPLQMTSSSSPGLKAYFSSLIGKKCTVRMRQPPAPVQDHQVQHRAAMMTPLRANIMKCKMLYNKEKI